MSNEVIPYQQMERMATAVANSKLFGCKSKDEAIALFLLAQAEGTHVMHAVRDFHVINSRPSMKAEAMMARFQNAGGIVRWHVLSDTKVEASFSHPTASPEPVKIEWTIERAQKAGLASRDVWKSYPRAMLRSRVVSEGIRTVLPGVLSGALTAEEVMHIETVEPTATVEQRLENFGKSMPNADVEHMLIEFKEAENLHDLKTSFQDAYRMAKEVGDEQRMQTFKTAYDARKAELETPPVDAPQQNPEI